MSSIGDSSAFTANDNILISSDHSLKSSISLVNSSGTTHAEIEGRMMPGHAAPGLGEKQSLFTEFYSSSNGCRVAGLKAQLPHLPALPQLCLHAQFCLWWPNWRGPAGLGDCLQCNQFCQGRSGAVGRAVGESGQGYLVCCSLLG